MADANIGEVDSPLGTLRCSLAAAKSVSAIGGGYNGVLHRLGMLDFDAYVAVAAAGLGKKPSDIEAKVYNAALVDLTAPFVKYVTHLSNGGKPFAPAAETDESGEA
jgi:hypothetical protein